MSCSQRCLLPSQKQERIDTDNSKIIHYSLARFTMESWHKHFSSLRSEPSGKKSRPQSETRNSYRTRAKRTTRRMVGLCDGMLLLLARKSRKATKWWGETKDSLSMNGEFIYRHHEEPRWKLYDRDNETIPIPLKYVDDMRQTQANTNNVSTILRSGLGLPRFQILHTSLPEGYKCGEWTTYDWELPNMDDAEVHVFSDSVLTSLKKRKEVKMTKMKIV